MDWGLATTYTYAYSRDVPNKTIYVSDDDLPLFQRAQEIAGGKLSTAIAVALLAVAAVGVRRHPAGHTTLPAHPAAPAPRTRLCAHSLGLRGPPPATVPAPASALA